MESSKKEIVIKKANDHWAFLEHIEAPMWVDLTLETKSCGEDINDAWFNTSHLFHQWSSKQLKSKFSHPGDGVMTSEVDFQGPPSPELPSSVSRSRGKHYKSKKWRGDNLDVFLDKQQAARDLSRKFFQADSCSGQEVKPKSNVIKSTGVSSTKPRLRFETKASANTSSNRTNPVSTRRNPTTSLSSGDNSISQSDTRSTITSVNTYQQSKYMEVSSQPCHLKRESLSFRAINLRKSCVTDGNTRQSRGRKSSSGKSSVGSSSNPGSEVNLASKQRVDVTAKNRCKPANILRESTVLVEGAKSGKRREINLAKPVYHRAANSKPMVQHQTTRLRALSPDRVNKQNPSFVAKEKLGTGKVSSLAGKGKENAARNVAMHEKISERVVPSRAMIITGQNVLRKGGRAGLVSSKLQGKANDQREAKNPSNLGRSIYPR